jgi:hypothetical protein
MGVKAADAFRAKHALIGDGFTYVRVSYLPENARELPLATAQIDVVVSERGLSTSSGSEHITQVFKSRGIESMRRGFQES